MSTSRSRSSNSTRLRIWSVSISSRQSITLTPDQAQQHHFLNTLFASLAVQHPELEPEYVSLVLTVDGLEHYLLRGLPLQPDETGAFELSRVEFVEKRISFLQCKWLCQI